MGYYGTWTQPGVDVANGASSLIAVGNTVPLFGYQNCLRAGTTGTEASNGQIYLDPAADAAHPYGYVFRKDDLTLCYDVGGCGTLDISTVGSLTLPDATSYVLSDIGPPSTVNSAPRVIEGVIVGG